MSKGLRTCCVCHKQYNFCPVCNPEDRKKPTWYFAYCGENCREIYKITSDYEEGRVSANKAKAQLDKLDLSKVKNFGQSYQRAIAKINENFVPVESEQVIAETTDKLQINLNKYYKKPKNKKVKSDSDVE